MLTVTKEKTRVKKNTKLEIGNEIEDPMRRFAAAILRLTPVRSDQQSKPPTIETINSRSHQQSKPRTVESINSRNHQQSNPSTVDTINSRQPTVETTNS
jgi:hypothetical protein